MITFPYIFYPLAILSAVFIGIYLTRWYYYKQFQKGGVVPNDTEFITVHSGEILTTVNGRKIEFTIDTIIPIKKD